MKRSLYLPVVCALTLLAACIAGAKSPSLSVVGQLGCGCDTVSVSDNLVCIGQGASMATVDVTDRTKPVQLGNVLLPEPTSKIVISRPYAYIADGSAGLVIVDIRNPYNPKIVSRRAGHGKAMGLAVQGRLVFITDTVDGLTILDVTEPGLPVVKAMLPDVRGWTGSVAARGSCVYAFSGDYLAAVDVTTPSKPVVAISEVYGETVAMSGNVVYIGDDGALEPVDTSDPKHPRYLPDYPWWEGGSLFAFSGSLACSYSSMWLCFSDLTKPWNPDSPWSIYTLRGHLPPSMLDITADDNFFYVAQGAYGLMILDPTLIKSTPTLAHLPIKGIVAGYGDRVYVAQTSSAHSNEGVELGVSDNGFSVIDAADPARPAIIGTTALPGYATAIAADSRYAYVSGSLGNSGSQFLVYDVSIPAKPALIGALSNMYAYSICPLDNGLVATANYSGISLIDVTNPAKPAQVSTMAIANVGRLVANGRCIYTTSYTSPNAELVAIDATNPTRPAIAMKVLLEKGMGNAYQQVTRVGNYIIAAKPQWPVVKVVDLTSLNAPKVYTHPMVDYITDVTSWDHFVVASDTAGGVCFYPVDSLLNQNIGDPVKRVITAPAQYPRDVTLLTANGNSICIARSGGPAFTLMSIPDLTHPIIASDACEALWVAAFAQSGRYLYTFGATQGISVIDTADPGNPVITRSLPVYRGYCLAVQGEYLFVGGYSPALSVYDITDPANPKAAGSLSGTAVQSMALYGHYAYTNTGYDPISILDISAPSKPVKAGELTVVGRSNVNAMSVFRDCLFLPNSTTGLSVHSLSDPLHPAKIADIPIARDAQTMIVNGTYLLVSSKSVILQIVDVSEPTRARIIGELPGTGSPTGISISGNRAYISDSAAGLRVIDISQPSSPVLLETDSVPRGASAVWTRGPFEYVGIVCGYSAGGGGFTVFGPSIPTMTYTGQMLAESGAVNFAARAVDGSGAAAGVSVAFQASGLGGALMSTNRTTINTLGSASIVATCPAGVYELTVVDDGGQAISQPAVLTTYVRSSQGEYAGGTLAGGRRCCFGFARRGPVSSVASLLFLDQDSGVRIVGSDMRRTADTGASTVYSGTCQWESAPARCECKLTHGASQDSVQITVRKTLAGQVLYQASGTLTGGRIVRNP